jgi:hypothetical protein
MEKGMSRKIKSIRLNSDYKPKDLKTAKKLKSITISYEKYDPKTKKFKGEWSATFIL